MRKTKPQRTILVITAVALAGLGVQAQEPVIPSDSTTYQKTTTDEQASSPSYRRDYDRRANEAHITAKDSKHGRHIQASKLMGKEVKNHQDERLGRVSDLIVSDDFTVKYAVLSTGALGVGGSKIAVPISDLQCGGDSIRLSATKDELKNAARTPSGGWMAVSGEQWTRGIDGYYGRPAEMTPLSPPTTATSRRFERESLDIVGPNREPVRTKQGAGAQDLINHPNSAALFEDPNFGDPAAGSSGAPLSSSDRMLRQSINDSIRQDYDAATALAVSVDVENGVVTLRGSVDSNAEKQNLESRVKAMSGVSRVNNQLTVRD